MYIFDYKLHCKIVQKHTSTYCFLKCVLVSKHEGLWLCVMVRNDNKYVINIANIAVIIEKHAHKWHTKSIFINYFCGSVPYGENRATPLNCLIVKTELIGFFKQHLQFFFHFYNIFYNSFTNNF